MQGAQIPIRLHLNDSWVITGVTPVKLPTQIITATMTRFHGM